MKLDDSIEVVDPATNEGLIARLLPEYQLLVGRRGVPPAAAARRLARRPTVFASMMLHAGLADAAICGGTDDWWEQMGYVMPIIPRRPDAHRIYGLSALILPGGTLFICDTHMNVDPTAEQLAEMTQLAADAVAGFGLTPKVALLSHSNFGGSRSPSARKMRDALALLRASAPGLEVDGEMHADAALDETIRRRAVPSSTLGGTANLLVMPSLDAANIAFNLLKAAAEGLPVGPMLLGMSRPVHVLVPSVTARGILNLSVLAAQSAAAAKARAAPA
jgi:malate dehydrogenase (oxaloacetate-decarboxylating)(NADP+)